MKIQLFTTALRKVREDSFSSVPAGVLQAYIELKDKWGTPLANGLYYVVVSTGSHRSIGKILVNR